jgi:proteasome assembly chaperone (PAC2) family protein
MEEIIYQEKPTLNEPYLILGFEGWPNAGEISSFTIQHLIDNLKAKKFASICFENFYEMTSSRPVAVIKEGRLRDLTFPGNHFYYLRDPAWQDVILFHGIEPQVRWNAFVDLVIDLAEMFRVQQIFTIGGTYDYVPHTYPAVVSALFNHDDLKERVIRVGLGLTEYSGPISIHTFILEAARKRNMKAMSLWGHAPQYLQTKNIKVALSVLQSLVDLTGISLDLTELRKASEFFDQQVNQLVEQDPKLREVIKKLEEIYQQSGRIPSFTKKDDESKKDEKVIYIQAFLKKQEDEDKREG